MTPHILQRIEACEATPCHTGVRIQAHGVFLGLDPVSLRIRRVSANCVRLLGLTPPELLGRPPAAWLHADAAARLQAAAAAWRDGAWRAARRKLALRLARADGACADAMLFPASGLLCVELQASGLPTPDWRDDEQGVLFDAVQQISQATNASATLADIVCRALRDLTGFERVYFCAFDANGHGHVRAQCRGDALPDLLDHHFPATDIPQQVRRLFRDNPFRLIADVEAPSVAIVAEDDEAADPLDLTLSTCRAVVGSHLQYLRNMGLRASVSFPAPHGDRLDGMFGGHHTTPRMLTFRQMMACSHLVALYQARAEALRAREEQQRLSVQAAIIHGLAARFQAATPDLAGFVAAHHAEFCAVAKADDLLCCFGEQTYHGRSLRPDQAALLLAHLHARLAGHDGPYAQDRLAEAAPELAGLCPQAAGVMAVALDLRGGALIAWLRREAVVVETWSGDPHRSAETDALGQVGPRRSFAAYLLEIKGTSLPWHTVSLALARQVQASFTPVLASHYEAALRRSAEHGAALKSEFVANVSHELRSPLHAILGFSDVLASGGDTLPAERWQRSVGIIRDSARRQLRLIDDLLVMSKLDHGHVEFHLAVADALAPVEAAVAECAELARARSVTIAVEDRRRIRAARIDCGRMHQVLANLLSNALRFSPPGGRVTVTLATSPAAAPGPPALLIEVADQGPGIPDAELDDIFGKFVQSSRTKHGGGGTGLGLAICRRIVQAHHGHIWAMNEPGGGARFRIELPQPGIGSDEALA